MDNNNFFSKTNLKLMQVEEKNLFIFIFILSFDMTKIFQNSIKKYSGHLHSLEQNSYKLQILSNRRKKEVDYLFYCDHFT